MQEWLLQGLVSLGTIGAVCYVLRSYLHRVLDGLPKHVENGLKTAVQSIPAPEPGKHAEELADLRATVAGMQREMAELQADARRMIAKATTRLRRATQAEEADDDGNGTDVAAMPLDTVAPDSLSSQRPVTKADIRRRINSERG